MSNYTIKQTSTLVEIVKPTPDPLAAAMAHSRRAVVRNDKRRDQAQMNLIALVAGVSGFVALIVSAAVAAIGG